MSTDTTSESAAADTENIDMLFNKLTKASVDSASDMSTRASADNTSETLTLASVDNTSDTLALANVDNTSDTSTLASTDNTSDTLTLASVDSTVNTLALAKLDRENQGPWEAEYSYGGEADLHQHYNNCAKNPGHKNFIPIDKFSIADLPEDYRDNNVVDYIRAVSELTVRVTVKYVSDSRPATVPSSQKPYPGYSVKGQRRMTVGTGWVRFKSDFYLGQPCKCKECRNSSTPEMNFATICLNTATHVVFDNLEGEHTTCHLFFDTGNRPDTCSGVVTLTGMYNVRSDVNSDICLMEHYTHDLDLAHRLDQTFEQMNKLQENIYTNVPQISKFKERRDILDRQPLLFIVSHPHGCSKQVSLGRWTSADILSNVIFSFQYNTATCPGSSGSSVCALPMFTNLLMNMSFEDGVHCGASDVQLDLNFCRSARENPQHKLVSLEMLGLDEGPGKDIFSCGMENDQNKHYADCKNNPGHRHFFPVETFNMSNLPSFYRREDLMKFVKLVSDLTVLVLVKYVSEKRPETVPCTDIPYPWSSNRGSNLMRVGSGFIVNAVIRQNLDCLCKECKNSTTPQQECGYISIHTAAHLVYDTLEAEHTTCHLFFDSGETPDVCKDVVTLTDMCMFSNGIQDDTCIIDYCTHNLDLVNRLASMINQYVDILHALHRNDTSSAQYINQNSGGKAKQNTPLKIVVSHPHGCAKQVSLGYYGQQDHADTEERPISHDSIVCPGSSGAPVTVLWQFVYPCLGIN